MKLYFLPRILALQDNFLLQFKMDVSTLYLIHLIFCDAKCTNLLQTSA